MLLQKMKLKPIISNIEIYYCNEKRKKIFFYKLHPKQPKWLEEFIDKYKESDLSIRIA